MVSCRTLQVMERPANTEHDTTPPAPGELELVRSFLSIHDHEPDIAASLPPGLATIAWWLEEKAGLLPSGATVSGEDLRWAGDVLEALRAQVLETAGHPHDVGAIATLDAAARDAGIVPRFGDAGLTATAPGLRGAIGRLLSVAFLAQLDGSWRRFKECSNPDCRSVFYDRSKNHSGRWCTMADCGNRAKVRAYRERERTRP